MIHAKKIYIDSRQSVSDVYNSANFRIELDRSYKMPPDTVFFITDCCIPHSWMTVETGSNDNIYFMASDDSGATHKYYLGTMPPGIYDGPGFANALNNATQAAYPKVSVLYTSSINKLDISITHLPNCRIKILSDREIHVF